MRKSEDRDQPLHLAEKDCNHQSSFPVKATSDLTFSVQIALSLRTVLPSRLNPEFNNLSIESVIQLSRL